MVDREIRMKCAYCDKITRVIIDVPGTGGGDKEIEIVKYCGHCRQANIIKVPDTWDRTSPAY